MAWNLRGYSSYWNWVNVRNKRIVDFMRADRRFKVDEFKIAVYFEQFLVKRVWSWSAFIDNFVSSLISKLVEKGYLERVASEVYRVKLILPLAVLEDVIREITPYLDPHA